MRSLDERAAKAVWLSRLASFRGGVVQRAVRRLGPLDALLSSSLHELRRAAAPRSAGPAPAGEAGACGGPRGGQTRAEASLFRQALDAGPPKCVEAPPGGLVLVYDDELYPAALRQLYDPPPALFVAGERTSQRLAALRGAPCVAVVGTRAPSAYGRQMARLLGGQLARHPVVVISGLALGVDVAAQCAALDARGVDDACELPATIAVLGCGVDVVHPRSNAEAFVRMRRAGLLVSEFWPGTPASPWRFPARNRVIAALSRAVVVVEGSKRSGSRITADLALQLGRDVLAVPGEAGRKLSETPHELLRAGAALCEDAVDVLDVLGLRWGDGAQAAQHGDQTAGLPLSTGGGDEAMALVLDAVRSTAATIDEVCARSGLPAGTAASVLGALEIEGRVERDAGGVYRARRG
jgi:DNA processing protein